MYEYPPLRQQFNTQKQKSSMKKLPLIVKIIIAIVLGVCFGQFFSLWLVRIFATFNAIFSSFLGFCIPLIILGLIVAGIAEMGRGAGKMLLVTVCLAYGFTLVAGFGTGAVANGVYPWLLQGSSLTQIGEKAVEVSPCFTIEMPPVMGVTSALVLAFILGLGIPAVGGNDTMKRFFEDFKDVVTLIITKVIIPCLPLYIFGVFLTMTVEGQIAIVVSVFLKIIVFLFVMTAFMLLLQFVIAGIVSRKNPFKMLYTMLAAYVTALGTSSSAATIPVTLRSAIKTGVSPAVANFVIPLCATIHLSGSTIKITGLALAMMMLSGMPIENGVLAGFIMMLGITMVAAPGVPGGAVMAALGLLSSILGLGESQTGLIIAIYLAIDSFGTATNVTGDGAIANIVDAIWNKKKGNHD